MRVALRGEGVRRIVPALLLTLTMANSAAAQEPTAPPPDPAAPITTDVFDLVRAWRHKPPPPDPKPEDYQDWMTAIAPVIGYSPTSGVGLGVAGNAAFYSGPPVTTKISSIVASLIFTTKKQMLLTAKVDTLGFENRWRGTADGRFYRTSQDTFGLGSGTSKDAAVNQKYNFIRSYETFYRRAAHNTYFGGGFLYNLHSDIHPDEDAPPDEWAASPYVEYSLRHGFDLEDQTSAGAGVNAMFDSRDGSINPSRGSYAQLAYLMFFKDFLGGSSNWQQVSYDARTYRRLTKDGRHKLAFWTFGDWSPTARRRTSICPRPGRIPTTAPAAAIPRGGSAASRCSTARRNTAGPSRRAGSSAWWRS